MNSNPVMKAGEKQLLTVTILPVNADGQTVTYSSSDENVAAINGMGRITAKSVGTAEISVSCGKITEKFVLTVAEEETEKAVSITDIELADYEEELEVDNNNAGRRISEKYNTNGQSCHCCN